MKLSCWIFGRPVDVRHVRFSADSRSVTLVADKELSTPCGTLCFPAGQPVFFGHVEVESDVIRPISGVAIEAA